PSSSRNLKAMHCIQNNSGNGRFSYRNTCSEPVVFIYCLMDTHSGYNCARNSWGATILGRGSSFTISTKEVDTGNLPYLGHIRFAPCFRRDNFDRLSGLSFNAEQFNCGVGASTQSDRDTKRIREMRAALSEHASQMAEERAIDGNAQDFVNAQDSVDNDNQY